jgi:heat shock protein HtpX
LLLAVMTAFIMIVGNLLGGRQGMIIALVLAAGMNFFSYWYSDKIVLKMYQAREATPQQAPELYEMVQTLARQASLPMPKVYIIPKEAPNAFATGRNPDNAVVAVTQGLLSLMNRQEIMGVLAHELAHVKNRDILIGTIAATMAGAIMMLAIHGALVRHFRRRASGRQQWRRYGCIGMIAMSIIAPMAAMIIQMAVSRSREYLADATGAQIAGSPEGLARALEKLGAIPGAFPWMPILQRPTCSSSTHCPAKACRVCSLRIRRWRNASAGCGASRPGSGSSAPPPPPPGGNRQETAGRAFWDNLKGE